MQELHGGDRDGVFMERALDSKLSRCYICLEASRHAAIVADNGRDMIGGNLGDHIDKMLLRGRSEEADTRRRRATTWS